MLPSETSDDDLDSRADTFTDQSSIQQQLSPQALRRNQPPTASTRRISRQLFAQKYGLNAQDDESIDSNDSPSFNGRRLSDPYDHESGDDSDDDQPLKTVTEQPTAGSSYQQPQQQHPYQRGPPPPLVTTTRIGGLARPISVCNIAEATSPARPPRFVKPATQAALQQVQVPPDMQPVQRLSDHFNRKVYMEGYLMKMNVMNTDGRPCTEQRWVKHYVELCGPVLTLWNATITEDQDEEKKEQHFSNPEYINITDSYVNLIDQKEQFMLNSAGTNRYVFQTTINDDNNASAQTWVLAIRLACFEGARIHEIYTRRFVSRTNLDKLLKQSPKTEGWLQVRFPGQTGWQKYWTVVTDRRTEKKLFGKKSIPTRGQLMFYGSKKAKFPVKIIVNVVQVYTIYPESPQLIDLATMMKVEGNILDCTNTGEQKLSRAAASTLLMTNTAKELTQWLVGTFDAFKLYGRPGKLLNNSSDSHALNFGEPGRGGDLPRLFLEVSETTNVSVMNGETLLDNKLEFGSILEQKMGQTKHRPSIPPPNIAGIMGSRTNSMPLLSGIPAASSSTPRGPENGHQQYPQRRPTTRSTANSLPSAQTNRHSAPLLQQQQNGPIRPEQQQHNRYSAISPVAAGRSRQSMHLIYASDDSEEDDDTSEDDDDDDTSSTSSTLQKTIPISRPTPATTSLPSPQLETQTKTEVTILTHNLNAPVTSTATATTTISSQTYPSTPPLQLEPKPHQEPEQALDNNIEQRRSSTMILPEISESTDFMSSILGDMSIRNNNNRNNNNTSNNNNNNNNNNNRGPPPPPPAHVIPISSTSTPILGQTTNHQRDISNYNNYSPSTASSSNSSTTSDSAKKAATPSPVSPSTPQQQFSGKSRLPSAMGWRQSSSNLLMRPQNSSSGSSVKSITPSGSETGSMGVAPQQQRQRYHHQHRGSVQLPHQGQQQQRRSMYMNDNGGRRSSSAILLQQHWETPKEEEHEEQYHQQQQQHHIHMMQQQQQQHFPYHQQQQQQQQYDPYGYQQYQQYADNGQSGHDSDDDAPIISQIGNNFVTQNSLLDMYQSEQVPARLQEEHARMSGQPLVNLPSKHPQPRSGLVGMISQLEHEKRERDNVKGRLMEMEKDRALEQERERFYLDHQQQQQRHSAMMQSPTPPAPSTPKVASFCLLFVCLYHFANLQNFLLFPF
ncbi:hypothetical protein BDC45DRAFT_292610 [Circinella umbellata]|nr:hypothetical protein BDC45DRAFT_292610 [Circinella umbellata]